MRARKRRRRYRLYDFGRASYLRLILLVFLAFAASASSLVEESEPPTWTVTLDLSAIPGDNEKGGVPVQVIAVALEEPVVVASTLARGILEVQVPQDVGGLLRFEAPGAWCPDLDIGPAWAVPGLVITCHPSAVLTGRLVTARGIERPVELIGTAEPSPDRTARDLSFPEEVRFSCSVGADGGFECLPPAGRFDLRLKADGFAGRYLWDLQLEPGERLDLGELRLAAGASLVGEVETADGSPLPEGVEVSIEPPTQVPGQQPERGSLREGRRVAHPGRGGFFQLEGLPPGRVLVSARSPTHVGGAPFAVDLREGLESTLRDPLVLSLPVKPEIRVSPPHDPQGKPWTVSLAATGPRRFAASKREGETAEDGSWRPEPLPAGRYALHLDSARGDRWKREEVEVVPDGLPILVDLEVIHVHGTLERDGEPVSAHLWFGGMHSTPRARFLAKTDGTFHGYLPRAGSWKVTLQWPRPAPWVKVELPSVEIPEPDAPGAVVEAALELPVGEVGGRVVDERGEGVPRALVTGVRLGRDHLRTTVYADADGRFDIQALTPGRYELSAQGRKRKSATEVVQVPAGRAPEEVRLTLGSGVVRGRVMSVFGPVAGAGVDSQPVSADGSILRSSNPMLQSDNDGGFEIALPPEATALGVLVYPEGHVARALVMPPSDEETLVEVGGVGGTLVLEPRDGDPQDGSRGSVLRWNGAETPLFLIKQRWADLHGGSDQWPGTLTLPRMEPAAYEFCSSPVRAGQPVERRCVSGVLAPSAELRLSLRD